MMGRALIVGIEKYNKIRSLTGCANDARAMRSSLARNEDGSPNYDCRVLISEAQRPPERVDPREGRRHAITRKRLREEWSRLFDNYDGDILFYFSGHGHPTDVGGYLVTQDAEPYDPGLGMYELLTLANNARARSVLLILDCCFSGALGNLPLSSGGLGSDNMALLREGLTILAASRPAQSAGEMGGYGIFTRLVVGALQGGAADVRGRVSAASIYAYVEQALGSWDQRPKYKSHATNLAPVRRCDPSAPDELLRRLPFIFPQEDAPLRLDPSYEHTHSTANPQHVALFNIFKVLRNARLLSTEDDDDLFNVAVESKTVRLTPLGRFYWQLAETNRLGHS
jgi:hypothetical protein